MKACNEVNTGKSIHELHPHEALVYLNRWAKLSNWYYDDHDVLYEVKDELIKGWVRKNQMQPTKVIERPNPTISKMRVAIANKGSDLRWLDPLSEGYHDSLSLSNYHQHLVALRNLVYGDYEIPLSPKEQERLQTEYQKKKNEYDKLKSEYKNTEKKRKQVILEAEESVRKIIPELLLELEKLPTSKSIKERLKTLKKPSVGTKHIYSALNILKTKGIQVKGSDDLITNADLKELRRSVQKPPQPQPPRLIQEIDCESYVNGSIPEVEAALQWARETLSRPELSANDLTDTLVDDVLEDIVAEEILVQLQQSAIAIFQQIVAEELSDQEAYDQLTELHLDYEEAIGMKSYHDFRNHIVYHADFGVWHKINLSPRGFWLVEFQSNLFPEITFHIPYDRSISLGISIENLPHDDNGEESYGREINNEEKKRYPILKLLEILEKDITLFPYRLREYEPPVRYRDRTYRYDEYEDDDDDFDDWN